jgi:hypothetical protein
MWFFVSQNIHFRKANNILSDIYTSYQSSIFCGNISLMIGARDAGEVWVCREAFTKSIIHCNPSNKARSNWSA